MGKKAGLADLIGRTIVAVTVKESERPPHVQLLLSLDNGRYYEVWSHHDGMGFGSMTYKGGLDAARSQGRDDAEVVFEVVAGEDGRSRETVIDKARDDIDGRKSLRTPQS